MRRWMNTCWIMLENGAVSRIRDRYWGKRQCVMGMPGAPWSKGLKHGKLGAGSSEHLRNKICIGTEGLASAQMLHPHGLLVPYFGRTRLGQGPAQVHGNKF